MGQTATAQLSTTADPRIVALGKVVRPALEGLFGDRLQRIILYGSRARGEGRDGNPETDSDWDVAAILTGPITETDLIATEPLVNAMLDRNIYLDLRLWTPEDIERPYWLFHDVRTEGIDL